MKGWAVMKKKYDPGCPLMSPSGYSCERDGEHVLHEAFAGRDKVTWGPPRTASVIVGDEPPGPEGVMAEVKP